MIQGKLAIQTFTFFLECSGMLFILATCHISSLGYVFITHWNTHHKNRTLAQNTTIIKIQIGKIFSVLFEDCSLNYEFDLFWLDLTNVSTVTLSCLIKTPPPYNKSDFRKNSEIARIASFGRTIVLWDLFDRILSKLFE